MMNSPQKQFKFLVNNHVHNVLIDKATLSLMPLEYKVKGEFTRYINDAILTMWIELHKMPDQPGMTRGQMVLAMASDTGASVSAVVRCACAFQAGKRASI